MAILLHTRPIPDTDVAEALARLAPDESLVRMTDSFDPASIEMLVTWSVPEGTVPRYPNLRLIHTPTAGVEKLLTVADLPAGLPITRTVDPRQNLQMAQYVVMMALRQARELPIYQAQQLDRQWRRRPVPDTRKISIAVLGLGATGQSAARMLQAVGFDVLGWSRSPRRLEGIRTLSGNDGFLQCLSESRMLACMLPLTPQTHHLLDAAAFARMPRGAYLISLGRGSQVDETALLEAIGSGQLAGAALDVQEVEPLPADSPLWDEPRVTITPHSAANPEPAEVARQLLENLRRVRAGEPLINQVDRSLGY